MKLSLILFAFYLPALLFARTNLESHYQAIACERYNGKPETMSDGTQCDIVTKTHAIEVDFASKWAEAIGQSLHYALMTGKHAGILLILEDEKDERHYERLIHIRDSYALPINVFRIEAWNEHFDIEDLARPKKGELTVKLQLFKGDAVPVFVDFNGEKVDYVDGLKIVRASRGWSSLDLANKLGVSDRTVEGWEQGRKPSTTALLLLKMIMES